MKCQERCYCQLRLLPDFLTAAHHLHVDHASGSRQASCGQSSVHAGQHATRTQTLAHQRSSAASYVPLGTPALLHGAPHWPVTQHV